MSFPPFPSSKTFCKYLLWCFVDTRTYQYVIAQTMSLVEKKCTTFSFLVIHAQSNGGSKVKLEPSTELRHTTTNSAAVPSSTQIVEGSWSSVIVFETTLAPRTYTGLTNAPLRGELHLLLYRLKQSIGYRATENHEVGCMVVCFFCDKKNFKTYQYRSLLEADHALAAPTL